MYSDDDRGPPTTPSLRGVEVRDRAVTVEVQDAPPISAIPSTRGRFLFALMRRMRELDRHDLPALPRAVLIVMADFADSNGVAWPAVATVAKTAGMSENTARKAIVALVKHGWLVVKTEATARSTARYIVRANGRSFQAQDGDDPGQDDRGSRGAPLDRGVHAVDPRGAGDGPQGCISERSGVQETDPRGSRGGPDPLTDPLSDPHKDPPNEAHNARAGALVPDGAQVGMFGGVVAEKPKRRKPALEVPLPADWRPTEIHEAFAKKHGLDLETEVFSFKGWAENKTRSGWNGTFSTRLANSVKWAGERKSVAATNAARASLFQRGGWSREDAERNAPSAAEGDEV